MKNTLFLLILLSVCSCSIFKNKSKQKQSIESIIKTKTELDSTVKSTETVSKSISDSTTQKTEYSGLKEMLSNSQNFILKNNGKCAEPGNVRLVQFTDAKGNQTSIPVNDNTDLSFGNETKQETELIDLKTENSTLKKEKDSISKTNEAVVNLKNNTIAGLNTKILDLDLQTKSSPLSAFFWTGILSIAVWEILKFYLKKQKPI